MTKKKNEITIRSSAAEYLTFVASTGEQESSIEMRYEDENIWLTQKMMAILYDVSISAINQHIKKIFEDDELDETSVIKYFLITAADGKNYKTNHYWMTQAVSDLSATSAPSKMLWNQLAATGFNAVLGM